MLDIVEYPNEVLARSCERVSAFDDSLKQLITSMIERMYASDGVGLAAPQIGDTRRVLLIDPSAGEEANKLTVLVNPSVTWRSSELIAADEGCLSLPGVVLSVSRSLAVEVDYDDVNGQHQCRLFPKMWGRIVQHEIDHLDGIMMLDRVGHLERKLAIKGLGKNR